MSVDMSPGAVSEETAGSDGSDPLAVGLSGPLGLCGAAGAATTAAYVAPPSGNPRCRPPVTACSPVDPVDVAGNGADPSPGAGRLVAGSEESPELANSLAFRFPAILVDERWEVMDAPPKVVLRLLVGTVGLVFVFTLATAFLNSFSRAEESWMLDIALRKTNSSCLSMTLRQAPLHLTATANAEQSLTTAANAE